jgi:hypothetical protein
MTASPIIQPSVAMTILPTKTSDKNSAQLRLRQGAAERVSRALPIGNWLTGRPHNRLPRGGRPRVLPGCIPAMHGRETQFKFR